MLETELPVNDGSSPPSNLWRENLEKAQYYKVPAYSPQCSYLTYE